MAFQVRIRINKNTIKVLLVAASHEEFEEFTIRELKRKALSFFPGVNDPDSLRVIFGQNELEDDQTFASCTIEHLSLLIIVLKMPGGGGSRDPGETEAQKKVNETAGLFGRSWLGTLDFQKSTQKTATEQYSKTSYDRKAGSLTQQRLAEERKSRPPQTAAAGPSLINAIYTTKTTSAAEKPENVEKAHISAEECRRKQSNLSDSYMRERIDEKVYPAPAEASSLQSDPDLQFLQSLLPSLKRMDVKRKEFAKVSIHQLIYDIEFNLINPPGGIHRTDSMEGLPPNMESRKEGKS